ncbi:hypothetical protein PGTUg99_019437 [Puccinia graminis f. sp. tritici]|nr:hypothetical protein PGTUg99_019437 [Puccinia graminis f. sp. tritici]
MESVTRRFASAVVTAVTGAVPGLSQVRPPPVHHPKNFAPNLPQFPTAPPSPTTQFAPFHPSVGLIIHTHSMRYSQPRAVTDEHCLSELNINLRAFGKHQKIVA